MTGSVYLLLCGTKGGGSDKSWFMRAPESITGHMFSHYLVLERLGVGGGMGVALQPRVHPHRALRRADTLICSAQTPSYLAKVRYSRLFVLTVSIDAGQE